MRSVWALYLLGAAVMPLMCSWTSGAGLSAYVAFSACINQTVERIICPGNRSMMYTAGDIATGSIPNCGLPYLLPATAEALQRTGVKLLHPNIVITNTTVIPLASRISDWMQYPLYVDVIDSVNWTKEPHREFSTHKEGIREAWFLDPVLTADMADEPVSALQDMSQLVLQDQNLNWNGYGTFFRRFASVYDGKVIGLPVSAAIMLLYYRRDFFEDRGIPVPATWEEVVDIAERYNGTDLDGSGRGAWGFCMSRQPRCYNGYTFQTIQVPFMQSGGTSQGFHFDPETMKPLVNSTGTRRAAELYRRLSRFTAPTEPVACLPISLAFVWGNCLMAVGTTLHFKYATFNNSLNNMTFVRGKTGTTVLPGSFEVMNRTTGRMVRCTPETCPHGKWHTLQNGTKTWVNAAPYAGRGAFTYAINRHREPHLQYMAYRLCARRVYADAMWPSVLSATAETTPVRSEMVDPANVGRYTAAGYDREDTLLFMKAVSETMEHLNIALNLRIYGALEYYFAVDAASVALSDTDRDIDHILAQAQADVIRLYSNVTAEWLKQRYWKSIDRQLPAPQAPASSGGMDARTRAAVGVGVGVGGGLLVFGAVAMVGAMLLGPILMLARQRKAYVPVASPDCTLVVTDMEGSTNMWEAFPGDVMAAALQTHDAVVRRVLVRHKGYESATEGDSFVLAFPNALEALRCSLELQAELLAADWPAVLLKDSDLCRPVYAAPRATGRTRNPASRDPTASLRDKDAQPLLRRSTSLRQMLSASRMHSPPPSLPAATASCAALAASTPRPAATSRTTATASAAATAAAAAAAGFSYTSGIAATLAAAAGVPAAGAATPTSGSRARSNTLLLQARSLQPPQSLPQPDGGGGIQVPVLRQQQPGLEAQSYAPFDSPMLEGALLGEVPEQYVTGATSNISLGSTGVTGLLAPLGGHRALSPHTAITAASNGGSTPVTMENLTQLPPPPPPPPPPLLPPPPRQHEQQPRRPVSLPLPSRVSPVSAPPREPVVRSSAEEGYEKPYGGGSGDDGDNGDAGTAAQLCTLSEMVSDAAPNTAAVAISLAAGDSRLLSGQAPAAQEQQQRSRQQLQEHYQLRYLQGKMSMDDPGFNWMLQEPDTTAADASFRSVTAPLGSSVGPSGLLPAAKAAAAALLSAAMTTMSGAVASGPAAGAAAEGKVQTMATAVAGAAAAGTAVVAGAGSGGGAAVSWPWGSEAALSWQVLPAPAHGAVMAYRGLRIRIGLHAGVDPGEVARNRASSRMAFSGKAIRMAKAVSDAAHGGMIVLSDTAASQLLGSPEVAALLAGEGTEVWHLGRVKLVDDLRDVEMFQVVTPSLAPRLVLQQPLRITSQLLPGVLSAPAGCVALVRLHVSGLALLRASEPELAAEVAGVLEELLLHSLPALGGYLSEARQGGVEGITVAFPDCLRAVAWALAVQADMLHWAWSPELLQNEAFETIFVDTSFSSSLAAPLHGRVEAPAVTSGGGGGGGGAGFTLQLATADVNPAPNTEAGKPATTSKGSYPPLYGSSQATSTGAITPAALSFSSLAGRPAPAAGDCIRAKTTGSRDDSKPCSLVSRHQPPVPATGVSGRTAGGGGGGSGGSGSSLISTLGQLQAIILDRRNAMAPPSTSSSLHHRSQKHLLWGPVRARAPDFGAHGRSLLSPLQPPMEQTKAAAPFRVSAGTDTGMAAAPLRTQPRQLQVPLPSFMRRTRQTQAGMVGAGPGGAVGGDGVEVQQGVSGRSVGEVGLEEDARSGKATGGRVDANTGRVDRGHGAGGRQAMTPAPAALDSASGGDVGVGAAAAASSAAAAPTAVHTTTTRTAAELLTAADNDNKVGVAATSGTSMFSSIGAMSPHHTGTTAAAILAASTGVDGAQPWHCDGGFPLPAPAASSPSEAVQTAGGPPFLVPMRMAELSATAAPPGSSAYPCPPLSISFDNTSSSMQLSGQGRLLFRGPRIKVVVHHGGVSTEVCRTTGRLLYRGRMVKQLSKLMTAAKWGQVLCTAAVYAQAAKAAPQVGISMAPVASGTAQQAAAAGRRKPAASTPGNGTAGSSSSIRPSPLVMAASGGSTGGGAAIKLPARTADLHDAATPNTAKNAQFYLCTLGQRYGERGGGSSAVTTGTM